MRRKKRRPARSLALIALATLTGLAALALSESAFALDGQIANLSGAVVARRADGGSRILSIKSTIAEGDLVITADNSYARIKWADGGEVVLRPNTQLKIDAYKYDERAPEQDNVLVSLIKGGLRSVTGLLGKRNPGSFKVATPSATIGIRGTHFGALVCNNDCAGVPSAGGGAPSNGLHVDVADGSVTLTTRAGTIELKVGDFGYVQNVNAPPVQVPPQQGVKVTLPQAAVTQAVAGGSVGKAGDLECKI
jgi:hypothetical protein